MSEEAFMDAVWDALKMDTNDLRKQQRILKAFRTAIAELEAKVAQLEEYKAMYEGLCK